MAGHDQYKRGELFRRYHLENIDNNVTEESSEVVDSALVESDNQSDLSVLDEVEVVPLRTTKRKAFSDENIGESKSARKVSKKTPKVISWSPERVELLLKYLKEYKVTCDFNGKEFEQDLSAMYTEIRRCLAVDFCDEFGPESPTEPEKPLKDMTCEEYQGYKKRLDKKQGLTKKGYDRVKEKIRNVRQDFRAAVNKGTRSGSGRIVQENYELLSEIWGGSPATTSLSFGIDGGTIGVDDDTSGMNDEDSSTYTSDSPNSSLAESHSRETPPPVLEKKKTATVSNIPKLVDQKRKHMEKSLSQAQRDQLLMNAAKEDVVMKKEMLKSFERSTKTMEDSISKMTDCLTSLGDGIATGMRLLANALALNHSSAAVNHHTPAWHPTQFDQYSVGGMVPPPSYNDTSYASLHRRASQQLNRIGSEQARPPSTGPGPILAANQALFQADDTDGMHYNY